MERLGFGYEALQEAQARPRLLRDFRLRAGRPAQGQSSLRPDRAGARRRDERHRRCGERAAAGRLPDRRHDRRAHRGVCHRGGAGAARTDRGGGMHRRVDARGDARHHGLAGLELADRRTSPAAARQREHDGGAVRPVRDRRRPAQHRRQPAAAVRDPGAADRPARTRRPIRVSPSARTASATGFALKAEIETALAAKSAQDWAELFNAQGVPAGEVLEIPEVLAHPQVAGRGLVSAFRTRRGWNGRSRWCAPASGSRAGTPRRRRRRRQLGADTAEVLASLGYTAEEIAALRKGRAI